MKGGENLFDGLKEDEGLQQAVATGTKAIIYGALVIGGFLFLERLVGFSFDLTVSLGI